jgi:hypothetical protein
MTSTALKTLTQNALDAFWAVVVAHYPQARTGDLSPWAVITLETTAQAAVSEWVHNNVPNPQDANDTDRGEHA